MTEDKKTDNVTDTVEEIEAEPIFAEGDVTEEGSQEEALESFEMDQAQPEIAELEAKIEEMDSRYLRLQADFDNSRRRARLDMEAAQKYRAQSLATDLLQALDNFERAIQIEPDTEQTKSLLQGMDMVHKGLLDALKKEGIEPIEAVGKEFDPHIHQAVMQVQDESFDSNVIVEELQKGYMLKDRVLRPAMVKVNE
ncbi:nucleotide exchange factor GrpE [Peribacillus cavernae]|uniref:Protein GrpE n=1 Tax=Peribacillus cavernae TaxID=1674310 RepID=A0A433HJ40_9BACI|nr:nucleotide exchange factor GrpE [Peribacillus cavernae]MDQ0218248.1 molecular chaperone GrpE [Peribacillus cavernae]RUQ28466.1 nucleotide exchange factor GrpE [Peribacillus cavernae]